MEIILDKTSRAIYHGRVKLELTKNDLLFKLFWLLAGSRKEVPKAEISAYLWPGEFYNPRIMDPRIFDLVYRLRKRMLELGGDSVTLVGSSSGYHLRTAKRLVFSGETSEMLFGEWVGSGKVYSPELEIKSEYNILIARERISETLNKLFIDVRWSRTKTWVYEAEEHVKGDVFSVTGNHADERNLLIDDSVLKGTMTEHCGCVSIVQVNYTDPKILRTGTKIGPKCKLHHSYVEMLCRN